MKSIWYLVGLLLLVMGALVLLAGIIDLLNPPATPKVLAGLHPNLWWGGIMVAAGALFYFTQRKRLR
jgi:hypothetical protein